MVESEFLSNTGGLSIGLATPPPEVLLTPNIGVIGVGGAGGNAVNNMVAQDLTGVSFAVANTDAQALSRSLVNDRIQLGVAITQGLGAGANPEVGRASAEETAEKIKENLQGLHLLFITAGMGGGTGTGAAPVIARIAKEMGILTVGVVSKPFRFEGVRRMRTAEAGIAELQRVVDTLIVIPNQNLFRIAADNITFAEAFKMADDVLCQGVRSITDLVMNPGLVNLDFADVKTVISEMGRSMMGTGEATGENRALEAAEKAIYNPLLDDSSIKGARSILINITGGTDLTLNEVDMATEKIVAELDPDANIIFGTCTNEELHGKIRISLVATGITKEGEPLVPPEKPRVPTQETIVPVPTISEIISVPIEPEVVQQPELIQTTTVRVSSPTTSDNLGAHRSSVVDIAVEVTEKPVVTEPPLFGDEIPAIPASAPVADVPDIQEPINVEAKRSDANVKTVREGLWDLFPSLMGKNTRPPKATPQKENKEIPTIMDENFDLPSFLKK
ncbi:MAG: cell division protein FtsZ [Alphaproteobacteria bacterium]|nr:cell division protein FtsZ [Alphaproteobacteria bacterium]